MCGPIRLFVPLAAILVAAWPCRSQPVASLSISGGPFCAPDSVAVHNLSQGNGPLTVSWFVNQEPLSDTSFHLTFWAAECNLYDITVVVSDSGGLQDTASLLLTVYCPPTVFAGHDTALCLGDTLALAAIAPGTVTWQPAVGLSDPESPVTLCFPDATTLYVLTATDSIGCTSSDTLKVTVQPLPSVTLLPNAISICSNEGPVQLTGIPDGGFFSGTAVTQQGLFLAQQAGPGTFLLQYQVTDSLGCTATDTSVAQVFALPELIVSEDTSLCAGDTVSLWVQNVVSATWWPAEGLSDTASLAPQAWPQSTTVFYVTGSNGLCSVTDSVRLEVFPLPQVSAGNDTTACEGTPLLLQASGAEQYEWYPTAWVSQPNQALTQFTGTAATWLYVTGTDFNGCAATDSVWISYVATPNLILTNDTSLCKGNTVQLAAAAADTYSWAPANSLDNAFIANPEAAPAATTTYTLTASLSGCSFSDQLTVTVTNLPPVDAGPPLLNVCLGDTAQLTATGASFYLWTPGAYLSNPNSAAPLAFPVDTTWYYVTGTDVSGCQNTDSILVIVLPLPQPYIFADSSLCAGDTIVMYATGGLYYSWQPAGSLNMPLNFSTLAFPVQTTTYTVTVMDFKGCLNTATHKVSVYPKPLAIATGPPLVCAGQPAQLMASGGLYYTWQPSAGLNNAYISNPVATVYSNTTYTVTVSNEYFCSDTAQVHLQLHPPLQASVCSDTAICQGDSAQLWAVGGQQYLWWPSESLSATQVPDPAASPNMTTTYQVVVSDLCAADTLAVTVVVQPPPLVNAGPDLQAIAGTPIHLQAVASPGSYSWSPHDVLSCADCLNPEATLLETTVFTLTVTDSLGCTASDTVTVTVGCDEHIIFVPNVFTPNGNGQNDVLYVRSTGLDDLIYFRVYDRWGKRIFETGSIGKGWDGRYNGTDMPAGTYLYEWQARCLNGEVLHRFGNVTLLR
ncbi:MAG: gliding motility-associated C-terminal domain-containing protein [Chitinophagales bacterium]|nr:gliding motility-associated C-terminal domain-containing protein [Chitinophagales bacterium]MDW8394043.1 gliding motility-associated C-terminal domain-containing protein [Chitinophagales bacterium]